MTQSANVRRALCRVTVQDRWLDESGMMRDAYFALAFSQALDEIMDRIGIDAQYRESTKGTLYTLELHQISAARVTSGATIDVFAAILEFDAKRIHIAFEARSDESDELLAAADEVLLHVVQEPKPHSQPFPESVHAKIGKLKDELDRGPALRAVSRRIVLDS
jgi:acyl-CoA thioester hydrolase